RSRKRRDMTDTTLSSAAHEENRDRSGTGHGLGYAAEDKALDAAATVGPQDDQVGGPTRRLGHDLVTDAPSIRSAHGRFRVDALLSGECRGVAQLLLGL